LRRPAPLGTVRATHTARASPWAVSGEERCWFAARAGCPALAVGVHEAGAVRWAVLPACADMPGVHRLARPVAREREKVTCGPHEKLTLCFR
jgi:hypothetical protein